MEKHTQVPFGRICPTARETITGPMEITTMESSSTANGTVKALSGTQTVGYTGVSFITTRRVDGVSSIMKTVCITREILRTISDMVLESFSAKIGSFSMDTGSTTLLWTLVREKFKQLLKKGKAFWNKPNPTGLTCMKATWERRVVDSWSRSTRPATSSRSESTHLRSHPRFSRQFIEIFSELATAIATDVREKMSNFDSFATFLSCFTLQAISSFGLI